MPIDFQEDAVDFTPDKIDFTPDQESIRAHMGDAVDALPGGYGFRATQPKYSPSLAPVGAGDALGQIPTRQFEVPQSETDALEARKRADAAALEPDSPNMQGVEAGYEAITKPTININRISSESAPALASLQNNIAGALEFFSSPLGISTMGVGMLPKLAQRAISGAFFVQMAKAQPQAFEEMANAINSGDNQRAWNAVGAAALNLGFTAGAGLHTTAPGEHPISANEGIEPLKINEPVTEPASGQLGQLPANEPTGTAATVQPEPLPRSVEPVAEVPTVESTAAPITPPPEAATNVPPAEVAPADRYAQITEELKGRKDFDSPDFQKLWGEREAIKNQSGGMPPEPVRAENAQPTEVMDFMGGVAPFKVDISSFEEDMTRVSNSSKKSNPPPGVPPEKWGILADYQSPERLQKLSDEDLSAEINVQNIRQKELRGKAVKEPQDSLYRLNAANVYLEAKRRGLVVPNKALEAYAKSMRVEPTPPVAESAPVETVEPIEKTPLEIINESKRIKIETPEGATTVRVTDSKGRSSVQSLSAIKKTNPFQGADIVKIEAGTIGKDKKFIPIKGEVKVAQSLGGQNPLDPGEIPKSELAQLTDSIKTLAESGKSSPAKAFDLGESWNKTKDRVSRSLDGLRAAAQWLKTKQEGKPVVTDYRRALGQRHLELSESAINARKWASSAAKAMPDAKLREAISNYVDAGGDRATIEKGLSETKPVYKPGYERALKLTPEEKTVADNLRNYFDARLQDAIDSGILEDGIENYIHRIYESDSPWRKGVLAELQSGIFTGKPALAKKRVFEYDFEAEKAGKRPIKDFVKRVSAYDLALNKAMADRAAVKAMLEIKMPDGRPMIDVGGGAKKIEGPNGDTDATLINRSAKKIDPDDPKRDRSAYKPLDYPALRKWKWVTTDDAGKPIFVQGDVLVHPDAISKVKALFERSAIRANPVGRLALDASSLVKQTMLDLSGFHFTQITVHGWEHRSFKPVKEIDFTNPDVRGLIKGGMSVGDTTGYEHFSEGLSGSSLTRHIPVLGERLQAVNSYLFNEYIPRLKVATGLHALERNQARFPKLSEEELHTLTASQMNAAFGELNYTMMGRSKTTQDVLRLALLAPDFLEARTRFVGQSATKFGKEQKTALAVGLVAMYVTARILNKTLDDEYHMELKNAFNVVIDGKAYGLRTVQGDLIHLATAPWQFIRNRLNPVYGRTLMEALSGRDSFGRSRDAGQQIGDAAKTIIPISVRGAFSGKEQTLFESFLNSVGIVEHRESPSAQIYQLANDFKKKNKITGEPGEFIYDPEKDPYRKIRQAASYYDPANVRSEIASALHEGLTKQKIKAHFELSANHKFTGSAANDVKFLKTLTPDQKKIYQDALKEREKIKSTVNAALQ